MFEPVRCEWSIGLYRHQQLKKQHSLVLPVEVAGQNQAFTCNLPLSLEVLATTPSHFFQLMNRVTTTLNRLSSFIKNKPVLLPQSCFWKTDIHSHLLPGVDDGASDIGQTLTCLRQLTAWGIQHIVVTPHVSQNWYPTPLMALLEGQIILRNLITTHQLPLTIEVSAEYMLDSMFLDLLQNNQLLPFGQEQYVLFETGWTGPPVFLDEIVFRLQTQGFQPVLAHPERYAYYHTNLSPLTDLHTAGCLFQLNWGSLVGRYGSRVQAQAHRLLKNKWVDFIGSDLHKPDELVSLNKLFSSPVYELLKKQPLRNEELIRRI